MASASAQTPQQTDPWLLDVLDGWAPERRPLHCSNCRHARVTGTAKQPMAHCAAGHGDRQAMHLGFLVRRIQPRRFERAADCNDFAAMDDEEAT